MWERQKQGGLEMYETSNWHVFDVANQRRKDLLLAARASRLIRRALTGRKERSHFYTRPLAWLGRWLVIWGWRLQERHGVVTPNVAAR